MKISIITGLIVFFLLITSAKSVNLNIEIEPNEVWIGDDVRIFCSYDDNTTHPTPWAYIERTSRNLTLTPNNSFYETTYTPPLLGIYEIFCSDGALNSPIKSFKVSSLSMVITDYPSKVYLGNNIVLHAKVIEKSDSEQPITSGIDFEVYLNTKKVPIDNDTTYRLGNEWIITTEDLSISNFNPGSYTLKLKAMYKDNTVSGTKNVEIATPVEFDLISIDKTEVSPDDNVTFTFKGLYEGNAFEMRKEYLRIWINSKDVDIVDIYQIGDYSYVEISVPNLQPGTYDLDIRFEYMGDGERFVKEIHETIDYVVPVSGVVKGSDDKAVYVQLNFKKDQTQKTFVTDGSGSYSGYLTPGIYDLEITFPNSKLILSEIMINEFDNPIKFDHPSAEINIPGIGAGAIFVYEIALTYSDVYLEMRYDDSKIVDETKIRVYKCENWNFGRKICNSDWEVIDAEIDTVRNSVELNTTDLSAFVIGYKKNLHLDFNVDKNQYFLRGLIKVTGLVEDDDDKPVSDVTITARIPNTDVSASTKTDNGGVFSMEFQGPNKEGNYIIFLSAEKSPFSNVNSSKSIKVFRSEKLSVLITDSIKIKQGENVSMPFEIVNTGQTDFSDLEISLTGIPDDYCILPKTEIPQLVAGNDEKLSIFFTIPSDAAKTSYTGNLNVMYDGNSSEELFILTILGGDTNETVTSEEGFKFPSINFPTAKVVLPVSTDVILVVIVGISSFSVAVFLKMRKRTPKLVRKTQIQTQIKPEKRLERENIKNLLLDIRREINRHPIKEKIERKR